MEPPEGWQRLAHRAPRRWQILQLKSNEPILVKKKSRSESTSGWLRIVVTLATCFSCFDSDEWPKLLKTAPSVPALALLPNSARAPD
jgi:hypothetical protein